MQKQISTIISLKDRFSQPLLKMSKNVDGLTQETRSSMNQVNRWGKQVERSVDRAVKAAARWVKRGAVLVTGFAIKDGIQGMAELDEYSRKVKGIARDRLELEEITQSLSDIRFELGVDMSSVGESFYQALSTNVPADMLEDITRISHKLSVTGMTDMENALSLIATTGNVFGVDDIEGYQKIADQILRTQQLGKVEVEGMANIYGKVSSTTQALGGTFAEQTAAIATMTMLGMKDTEATTGYRGILNAFSKGATGDRAKAIEAMGLGKNFLSAATYEAKGFGGVMKDIIEATGGDMDKLNDIFPEMRAKTGFTKFLEGGDEEYFRIYEEIIKSTGTVDDAYEIMDNSITRNWQKIRNRVKELNQRFFRTGEFGEGFAGLLGRAADYLEENEEDIMDTLDNISKKLDYFFNVIRENKDLIKTLIQFLTSFYILIKAARGIERLGKDLETLKGVFSALREGKLTFGLGLGKVAIIAAAIVMIGKAVKYMYDNWDEMVEKYPELQKFVDIIKDVDWKQAAEDAKELFADIRDGITETIEYATIAIANLFGGLATFVIGAMEILTGLFKMLQGLFSFDLELFNEGASDVVRGTDTAWEGMVKTISAIIEPTIDLADMISVNDISGIKTAWQEMSRELEKPITIQVKTHLDHHPMLKNTLFPDWLHKNEWLDNLSFPGKYKGTPNWRGGLVNINERGGEILDLPGGTRIYPHDKSVDMARNQGMQLAGLTATSGGQNISFGDIYFTGDIKSDMDINEIGTKFVEKVKRELNNI